MSAKYFPRRRRSIADRFWEKVDKSGPVPEHVPHLGQCWVWTAAIGGPGYGEMSSVDALGKSWPLTAHRVAWTLEHGEPGHALVLHKCDNRRCVRVDHLFLGTHADNVADKMAKGRHPHANAKLTTGNVREIRLADSAGCDSRKQAVLYNISYRSIRRVVTYKGWEHIK